MSWSTKQEELLRAYGHQGAEAVQGILLAECGVYHTIHAIEMHASRIHVSLRKLETCPECGSVGAYINQKTGLCPLCTEMMHVEEERLFNELLEAERMHSEDSPEVQELRREYARLRQANSRLCRKYRLQGKRDRK